MWRSRSKVLVLLIATFAFGAGCETAKDTGKGDSAEQSCVSDIDCLEDELCVLPPAPTTTARIMAMCRYAPCGPAGECGDGLVCITPPPNSQTPGWGGCPSLVCAPPCSVTGCLGDLICKASGACGVPLCTDPGAAACPEHWRCDPAAAGQESSGSVGSIFSDLEPPDAHRRGCARKKCDEEGGFTCAEFWECDPSAATDPTGCVPLPCTTTGHCEWDDHICEPTSNAQRPSTGTDYFGCVPKNCEEGFECGAGDVPSAWSCDPSAPEADTYGCVLRKCVDGHPCGEGFVCDQSRWSYRPSGCRPKDCRDGEACPAGFVCRPEEATPDGCAPDPGVTGLCVPH
jgi:hypothetical protein